MKSHVRQLYNFVFDRVFRISTAEGRGTNLSKPSALGDQIKYVPIDYLALAYLFKPVRFTSNDVFVDVGCGLGRAVLMAARRSVRLAVGIEYDQDLCRKARQNAFSLRGRRARVEILDIDATKADYTDATIIWMYNPFGEATMVAVLDRIEHSLAGSPRSLLIIYAFPLLAALLDARRWLRRKAERRFPGAGENGHAIYWEAVVPGSAN
jgi:SAM-dependent methyltransferase